MSITNCPRCGACYEESSEEAANSPSRECMACYRARPSCSPIGCLQLPRCVDECQRKEAA